MCRLPASSHSCVSSTPSMMTLNFGNVPPMARLYRFWVMRSGQIWDANLCGSETGGFSVVTLVWDCSEYQSCLEIMQISKLRHTLLERFLRVILDSRSTQSVRFCAEMGWDGFDFITLPSLSVYWCEWHAFDCFGFGSFCEVNQAGKITMLAWLDCLLKFDMRDIW